MIWQIFSVAGIGDSRIGVMPRPRGGDWLGGDLRSAREQGFSVIVSLLTDDEQRELKLQHECTLCGDLGLTFRRWPITDLSVPELNDETIAFLAGIRQLYAAGNSIAIHCRAGMGRSPMIAACVMLSPNCSAHVAFHKLSGARGFTVPETPEQREWAASYEKLLLASKKSQ